MKKSKKSILFLARHNNDFERGVAVADYLGHDYDVHFVSVNCRRTLKNQAMFDLVKEEKRTLKSFFEFEPYGFLIHFLNAFPKNPLFAFFSRALTYLANKRVKRISQKIIDSLKPNLVFIDYITTEHGNRFFYAIHGLLQEKKIPIVMSMPGINTFFPKEQVPFNTNYCFSDYLISPNKFDLIRNMLPIFQNDKEKGLIIGDPRLSEDFILKLKERELTQRDKDKDKDKNKDEDKKENFQKVVSIFTGNSSHVGLDSYGQDEIVLAIIKELIQISPNVKIWVKFHPRTPTSSLRGEIASFPQVSIKGPECNTTGILAVTKYMITSPGTVIFEAAMMKIPILLIDVFGEDVLRLYQDICFHSLSFKDLDKIKTKLQEIDEKGNSYNQEAFNQVTRGGRDYDCRRDYKNLIDDILEGRKDITIKRYGELPSSNDVIL